MAERSSVIALKTLNKILGVLSLIGWAFFIIAMYMFHYATPAPENLYDTILENRPQTEWNTSYADMFMLFMSIGIFISLFAFFLNIYLYKAQRTHIWINLLLLLFTSGGILIYFVRAIHS